MMDSASGSETGGALVETALVLPLVILVMLGAIDFGRVFFRASAVSEAVQAGVHYGSRKTNKSDYTDPTSATATSDYSNMETIATRAAADLSGFTPDATSFCTCSAAPTTAVTCSSGCSGTGNTLRYYVQVEASSLFQTTVPYPGIPHTLTITRRARMQVMQ